MKNNYKQSLMTDCKNTSQVISDLIATYLPKDAFDDSNRERFIKEVDSNPMIKHSHSVVCIIEYSTSRYVYVSENIKNEVNVTAAELLSGGLGRAFNEFTESQKKITLEEIYPAIFQHYGEYTAKGQAQNLQVMYNTLLRAPDGKMKWFLHQLSVLAQDEKGFPTYGLKFLSNIDVYKKDSSQNLIIQKINEKTKPEIVFSKDYFPHHGDDQFSTREKEILDLVMIGYTSCMIADKLSISMNTVVTHRRNIAKKTKEEA